MTYSETSRCSSVVNESQILIFSSLKTMKANKDTESEREREKMLSFGDDGETQWIRKKLFSSGDIGETVFSDRRFVLLVKETYPVT